jgi:hypothetical protein
MLVQGAPVLVDRSRPRLGRLTDDATVASWSCLEVRAHTDPARRFAVRAGGYAAIPACLTGFRLLRVHDEFTAKGTSGGGTATTSILTINYTP